MAFARTDHNAILLDNGKVLVVGGANSSGIPQTSAELYDPSSGTFSITGSMNFPRQNAGAVLLADGRVLVVGGWTIPGGGQTTAAEIYNPETGTWTPASSMHSMRTSALGQSPILLPDGTVLIAGGDGEATSEIYFPDEDIWDTPVNMGQARAGAATALMFDGRVLITGGNNMGLPSLTLASTQIYVPAVMELLPQPQQFFSRSQISMEFTLLRSQLPFRQMPLTDLR